YPTRRQIRGSGGQVGRLLGRFFSRKGRRGFMLKKFGRPSPALVVASIALFVALTGGAFAAGQAIPLHAKNADHAKVADQAKVAAVAKVAATATNALKLGGKT